MIQDYFNLMKKTHNQKVLINKNIFYVHNNSKKIKNQIKN